MQDAKEEVRARLNIEDVVGEYVQLKRAGRNFKGLSPFSGEKTPSFIVSPDKHIWHDFSSGRGGDIFTFIMEVEGMDFREALEHLARKAGVDLSMYDTKANQGITAKKKRLREANELACKYYQQSLLKNPHAVEYVFKARKLSKKIVQTFRIGYAPATGNALTDFLTKKGYTKQELAEAGLVNRFGGDLFRGRMMVPLMDGSGQVIGFTARILDSTDTNAPKYLNTPQTLLYDKSHHVFGLSQAKEAIRSNDYAVIVEGNLDVVSSHQVDVLPVVATAGTAMTEYHLKALRRLTGNVRLAFDGDKAGLAATERAIAIAQAVGVELTIVELPEGAKDPDELIQQDPTLWQQAIANAVPVIDWILTQYSKREDLQTAAGKRAFTTAALTLVAQLVDAVEQDHYLQKIATYTASSREALQTKLHDLKDHDEKVARPMKVVHATEPLAQNEYNYQDNILAVALIDPATHELFAHTDPAIFEGEQRQAVIRYLLDHSGNAVEDTPEELQKYDTYVKIVLLKADARYADWNDQDRYFETARLLRQVATKHKEKQKDALTEQLRDAEAMGDDDRASEIRTQLSILIKEITSAKK